MKDIKDIIQDVNEWQKEDSEHRAAILISCENYDPTGKDGVNEKERKQILMIRQALIQDKEMYNIFFKALVPTGWDVDANVTVV